MSSNVVIALVGVFLAAVIHALGLADKFEEAVSKHLLRIFTIFWVVASIMIALCGAIGFLSLPVILAAEAEVSCLIWASFFAWRIFINIRNGAKSWLHRDDDR